MNEGVSCDKGFGVEGTGSQSVGIYGDLIDSIILYGLVTRGLQTAESDLDVVVIIWPDVTVEIHARVQDLAVEPELARDKLLSTIRIDYERFKEWENSLSFCQNISKRTLSYSRQLDGSNMRHLQVNYHISR